jgi:hypothetical protein
MDSLKKIWGRDIQYAEWCTTLNDVGVISRISDPVGRFFEI